MSSHIRTFLTGVFALLTALLLTLAPAAGLTDTAVRSVKEGGIRTAVYGGSLKDNIAGAATTLAINDATAFAHGKIGDVKEIGNWGEGSFPGAVLKGAAGCISSDLSGGNCGRGAVLAAGAEFATGILHSQTGGNTDATAEAMLRYGNPVLAALTSGGDVGQFGINQGIADSQLKNNYLTHTDLADLKDDYAACKKSDGGCSNEELLKLEEKYRQLSEEKNAAMEACPDRACIKEHLKQAVPKNDLSYLFDPAVQDVLGWSQEEVITLSSATQDEAVANVTALNNFVADHCAPGDVACIDQAQAGWALASMAGVGGTAAGVRAIGACIASPTCSAAWQVFELTDCAMNPDPLCLAPGPSGVRGEVTTDPLLLPKPSATGSARRYEAGVASYGNNLPVIKEGETWLRGSDGNAGKVPQQVAEKLAGKEFRDFDHFREEFWMVTANDPVLSKQFGTDSLREMTAGRAPYAIRNQQQGGRIKYELDHSQELQNGGNVYDMSNIIIRTPLNHIKGK